MTSTQNKKRGCFVLNIDDMDRYTVDLRRNLDREKRRFQSAKMLDEFESQLRTVLKSLNSQGDGQADANGANNQQPPNPENEIKITVIDKENLSRLLSFLKYLIEMCLRIEQQDLMQEVLRNALTETRRKRFKSQLEAPGAPMEPFCLFCANDLNGALVAHCRDESHRQQQVSIQALTNVNRSASMPRVELVHMTPPPSAMPTPDVGDQAGIYTPNINPTPNSNDAQNSPTTTLTNGGAMNREKAQQPGFLNGLLQMNTNASAAAAASAASTAAQPPSASPASSDIVGPSDIDGTSSDDNEPLSPHDITDWANRTESSPDRPGDATSQGDNVPRRCSTPLGDDPERTMPQLVIDESSQSSQGIASPIYRPSLKMSANNAGSSSKSIKTMIKGGKTIAASVVVATVSSPQTVDLKPHLKQVAPLDLNATRPDLSATRPIETSSANLSKVEQFSTRTSGAQVRTKFRAKRRNRND